MADGDETTRDPRESVGADDTRPNGSSRIVDKRTSTKIKYGELEPSTDKRTQNRLSNTRWPLGEEPGAEGTHPDDPWVNVKLEVVEHEDTGPNQRHLLHGGVELRMKCSLCHEPLHVAASQSAKEILERGGFKFKEDMSLPDEQVVACTCLNGHVTQLRESFIRRLVTGGFHD